MANKKNADSKLQGISRLITDATIGVTDLVESMHHRIVHPPFLPSTPIQHLITNISGIAYKNIRWSTRLIGSSIDKTLGKFVSVSGKIKTTQEREVLQSVLNGIIGDYLEKTKNPLSISMQFRNEEKAIPLDKKSITKAYPFITGKILLMVHGSCMNAMQWTRKGHNHGAAIAEDLEKNPIYLQYNSGLHISTNGQKLNELLEKLVLHWPVPVEEIVIIAHSMGGLVSRSAIHYGQQQKKSWTKHLKKIIFLGTPHHGAPLEKAGNYLDVILEAVPYAKPFARLGKIRSAGVIDLRYGNLLDTDWKDRDRFEMQEDKRQHVPLPKKIGCYSIAAVASKNNKSGIPQLLGDNMVGVKSALGQHKNPDKNLNFKKKNTWIVYENNHLDLLSNPKIYSKIKTWMLD
ncbi:esterase/lipase family protein [Lacinutrix sp. MEBiC02404]